MKTFVGVDGGGSKTHVVATDDCGRVLLETRLDGCDLPARGEEHVRRVLAEVHDAVTRSLDAANVWTAGEGDTQPGTSGNVVGLAVGLPFYGESDEWDQALDRITADVFRGWPYRTFNDVRLALEGAFPSGSGVLVLCGTGSMAWGKDPYGHEARCGGWGPLFGDEGSGFDLGMNGLRAVCRMLDGRGPATRLHAGILEALEVDDIRAVLTLLGAEAGLPRARIASLARAVGEAADAGDDVAAELVASAASDLADHVDALVERLTLGRQTAVSTAGGLFHSHALASAFAAEVHRRGYPPAVPARYPPVVGGLLLAGLAAERLDTTHWA